MFASLKNRLSSAFAGAISTAVDAQVEKLGLTEYARLWLRDMEGSATAGSVGDPYANVVWVFRCVQSISENCARVPLRWQTIGDQFVESGPLCQLFDNPDPLNDVDGYEFIVATVGHHVLTGDAFWIMDEQIGRRPGRLVVCGQPQMEPILEHGRTGPLVGWKYTEPGMAAVNIPRDQVIRIGGWNPNHRHVGTGPAKAAALSINQDYFAARYNESFFRNDATPGGALTTDRNMPDTQIEQLRTQWNSRHRGIGASHKTAILHNGLTWQSFAPAHSDMLFPDLKKMSRDEILASFGVPPVELGIVEDANRSNSESQREIYWVSRIIPLLKRIESKINGRIAPLFGGNLTAAFDLDEVDVIQEMRNRQIESALDLLPWGVPLNDVIDKFNLGLPTYPHGETAYIGFNVLPVGESVTGPEVDEDEEGGDEGEGVRGCEGDSFGEAAEALERAIETAKENDRREQIWKRWAASWQPIETRYKRRVRGYFNRLKSGVLSRLNDALNEDGSPKDVRVNGCQGGGVKSQRHPITASPTHPLTHSPTHPITPSPHHPLTTKADDSLILSILFDLDTEAAALSELSDPFFADGVGLGGSQIFAEAGHDGTFSLDNRRVQEYLRQKRIRVGGVSRTVHEQLRNKLRLGFDEGRTLAELSQDVRGVMKAGQSRSLTIARTETAQSVSGGRQFGMEQAGTPGKSWLSARDGTVRETHQAAEAQYLNSPIPVDQLFVVGAAQLMFPADPNSGDSSETINCRCVGLPANEADEGQRSIIDRYERTKFLSYGELKSNEPTALAAGQEQGDDS